MSGMSSGRLQSTSGASSRLPRWGNGTIVREEIGQSQRERILGERVRAIQWELGEVGQSDLASLRARFVLSGLPGAACKEAERELERRGAIGVAEALAASPVDGAVARKAT